MQKIKNYSLYFVAILLILSQFNLPGGETMRIINAQPSSNSSLISNQEITGSDETTESSSDLPPEPPKDFELPNESSSETASEIIEESSNDETSSSESSNDTSESNTDGSSVESSTSEADTESSSSRTDVVSNNDETPVQSVLPGSLMIKPMNMLEPVNVPTTVRRIISYYGNIGKKLFRTMVPFGQQLFFPYEGEIINVFNLAFVEYFENVLGSISN